MDIDWFTVIAQIINFLILVWLLKRFLYKPVLNAIDEREKTIASQLEEAANKKREARQERETYIQKNEEFDRVHATQLEEARKRIEDETKRLYEEARQETSALRLKLEESLKQQGQELRETVKRKTKEEVFAIATKVLTDLANAELEGQIMTVFIEKIRALNETEQKDFRKALQENGGPIRIITVFEPAPHLKHQLEQAVQETTGITAEFEYFLDPDLLSGIMLETTDYQLSWSIESYLESLKLETITK